MSTKGIPEKVAKPSSKSDSKKDSKKDKTSNKKEEENPFLSFLKKNWPTLLVILYILSPIDFLPAAAGPLAPVDDLAVLIAEVIRRIIIERKATEE